MIELAQASNPAADFKVMDCRDIPQLNKKYDGLMCGFGLPYLSKEESLQLIRDAAELLHPSGIFYLSTMEDDYQKSGFKRGSSGEGPQIYIHFHQADYLTKGLEDSGFEILDLRRKEYPGPGEELTKDLIIVAALTHQT